MKSGMSNTSAQPMIHQKALVILNENKKIIIQFLLTAIFIYTAVWFINHERPEIGNVRNILVSANMYWIFAGLVLVAVYIFLRGLMYVTSFASINIHVSMPDGILLFLKRNFISVFLPAGGVSSLIFFTNDIEKKGITKSQIFFASSVNAFTGILTVAIVALPVFLFVVSGESSGRWLALGSVSLILGAFVFAFYSLIRKTSVYRLALRMFPAWAVIIEDMSNHRIKLVPFMYTVLISIIVEFLGIAHVYISMLAVGVTPSLTIAIVAYIIVVLFLLISPFLRGLGAIEVSMTYVLMKYGFGNAESIAVTMIFRFFEFWVPLATGMLSFLQKTHKLFLRILPAVLIFALGIVNVISVVTPSIPERMKLLHDFLMVDVIRFSKSFVLVTGLFLLVNATFMLRGLRSSWWIALVLSAVSIIGHLTKGIDYEEAVLALIVIGALLATRKEYYVKSDPRLGYLGIQTSLFSILAVILFGIIGFYFLDKKHFNIEFNAIQSVRYTLQNFILVGSPELTPVDQFSRDFLNLIKVSGFVTMAFLVYSVIRPFILKPEPTEAEKETASAIVRAYGQSSLDYFKTYFDKLIFAPSGLKAFISYRISRNFAIVLEDPVAENREAMRECIVSFSEFCYENGLKDIYYRVPAESLPVYTELSRKSLFIGQEAIVDLDKFSLSGGEKKPLRNALNKIKSEGYITKIYEPPLKDGLIQKLKSVSDDWLKLNGRTEIIFSQGIFSEEEIKAQTVIAVENNEEMIMAFLNIIPDYSRNEGTYDLLRKRHDAPNGVMDHLMIEMFNYFKGKCIRFVNLGFAPMSGVNDPHNFPERSVKFAYEKIRSFSHYKGLREYKEKFSPIWNDKFLIYSNDYDLLRIPIALGKAIKS
jgi:phosphatidylglycerol lysyltransferase